MSWSSRLITSWHQCTDSFLSTGPIISVWVVRVVTKAKTKGLCKVWQVVVTGRGRGLMGWSVSFQPRAPISPVVNLLMSVVPALIQTQTHRYQCWLNTLLICHYQCVLIFGALCADVLSVCWRQPDRLDWAVSFYWQDFGFYLLSPSLWHCSAGPQFVWHRQVLSQPESRSTCFQCRFKI